MSNFVEVIGACESANGAGTKKLIQAALSRADERAQALIHAALDPYKVYGVRKLDHINEFLDSDEDTSIDDFLSTLCKLSNREITGDAARVEVQRCLSNFSSDTYEYFARIIDKDLKAGFSAATFNKIFPNNKIASFEVMLADKCNDTSDFEKYVSFPVYSDTKLDGERNIATVKHNSVNYFSRSGKEASHVNGLFDGELLRIRDILGYDYVMDGERYASDFTETVNAKKSDNQSARDNLRYMVFFMMPYTDWLAQSTKITMRQNQKNLKKILDQAKCEKLIQPIGKEVHDYQEMMDFCNQQIDAGFEGLILKDWESTYRWDRSYAWTKVKRFYDVDCRVVGFYTGREKTRLAGTLGGISVVGFTEDGTRVEVNVGSGFSDADRDEIWKNQQRYLGGTAVIKYQDITRSKGKEVASLRFPTFSHFRDDKIVEVDDE